MKSLTNNLRITPIPLFIAKGGLEELKITLGSLLILISELLPHMKGNVKADDMLCTIQSESNFDGYDTEHCDDDMLEQVRTLGQKYNIHTIIPLNTRDIAIAHWVQLKCKFGCQKFGKSWCCPPETPTPDKTEALLKEYQKALLLCGRLKNGDFYKNNSKKRKIQVNTWKGTVALERYLFLAGYYKAFSLVSESCALCKKCLYPLECKFPMDRRPSVESCSIDIFQTLKNIGKPFELVKNVNDEYNCYSIILLE